MGTWARKGCVCLKTTVDDFFGANADENNNHRGKDIVRHVKGMNFRKKREKKNCSIVASSQQK
jgi:hypothetical protein